MQPQAGKHVTSRGVPDSTIQPADYWNAQPQLGERGSEQRHPEDYTNEIAMTTNRIHTRPSYCDQYMTMRSLNHPTPCQVPEFGVHAAFLAVLACLVQSEAAVERGYWYQKRLMNPLRNRLANDTIRDEMRILLN